MFSLTVHVIEKQSPNDFNQLNRPAHKTEVETRMKTMRVYPFISTGNERDDEAK